MPAKPPLRDYEEFLPSKDEEMQTMESFLAEMKRIDEGPWLARAWYYRRAYLLAPWRMLRETRERLIAFWQRGQRGWAISDTWNGDIYLARVIAELCTYLKAHNSTTPYPFYLDEEHGHDAWEAYLGEMAAAFGDYVAYMDGSREDFALDEENKRFEAILARMRPIVDHWSSLND